MLGTIEPTPRLYSKLTTFCPPPSFFPVAPVRSFIWASECLRAVPPADVINHITRAVEPDEAQKKTVSCRSVSRTFRQRGRWRRGAPESSCSHSSPRYCASTMRRPCRAEGRLKGTPFEPDYDVIAVGKAIITGLAISRRPSHHLAQQSGTSPVSPKSELPPPPLSGG